MTRTPTCDIRAEHIVIFERLSKDQGGVIAVSRTGQIAMPCNTKAMIRGAADARGRFEVMLRGSDCLSAPAGRRNPVYAHEIEFDERYVFD